MPVYKMCVKMNRSVPRAIKIICCVFFLVQLLHRNSSSSSKNEIAQFDNNETHLMSELFALNCPGTLGISSGQFSTLKELQEMWKKHFSDNQVLKRMDKCETEESVATEPIISLAFGITADSSLGSLEILLDLLSRPGHTICIHVDAKSSRSFHVAVERLVSCYSKRSPKSTIFTVPNPMEVYWGHISILNADLRCLELSLQRNKDWAYFLNMASTALPTFNMNTVEGKLAALEGKSVTCGFVSDDIKNRTSHVHTLEGSSVIYDGRFTVTKTNVPKSPPPHNLTIYKSSREVILNRTFAEFILNDPVSKSLLNWLSDAKSPVEMFFGTLDHPKLNNENLIDQDNNETEEEKCRLNPRYSLWTQEKKNCHGLIKRGICQFSVLDFPALVAKAGDSLFVNKFNVTEDAFAAACWAESVS